MDRKKREAPKGLSPERAAYLRRKKTRRRWVDRKSTRLNSSHDDLRR